MKIIHRNRIEAFVKKYPDSQSSLSAWVQIIERNHFAHFPQLREIFNSADYVKPYTVFNISGNKYRLIVIVNYVLSLLSVEQILLHKDYDKGKWRE